MATAASKLNSAYWRKRTLQQAERQIQADEKLNQDIAREYKRILHELDKELAGFYARYAQNESISMVEARRLLKDAELEDFRMSLDEFRAKAIAGGYDKELNEIYLRTRVSRLQALQTQIRLRIQELFQEQQEQLHDHLAGIYTDTYYQTVYAVSQQTPVLASFARIDTEVVEKLLSKPWLDSDFSSRIWADRDKLLRELETALSRSFVRGEPLQRVSKQFAERMGVSQSRAATLIHTESAHVAAEATARGYQETGVNEYTFDASLDLKTCPICGAMDGMTFKVSERETGVNYPPVHPRCRCTTVPETEFKISSGRTARNPVTGKTEYVDQGMTYSEWHKKYIEDDPAGALAEKMSRKHSSDAKQWREYRSVLGKNAPKSLEEFQRIKYTESEEWRRLMENKRLFSKIDSTDSYSAEYKSKLKKTYQYFSDEGFEFREHALNRVLGQKSGKDKFTFTNEELLDVLKKPYNYRQPDGKQIRFYNGIAVVSAEDTGEIVSVVVKRAARKDWDAI